MAKFVDYDFNPGKYNDLKTIIDDKGFETKMRAFINLLHIRPGMIQDCPNIGIDFNSLVFSENREVDEARNRIQNEIYTQCAEYIDPDLISDISISSKKSEKNNSGETDMQLDIIFTNEKLLSLTGKIDTENIKFIDIKFDGEPFKE